MRKGNSCLKHPQETVTVPYTAVILALGGGSWKKLGSDGAWVPLLEACNIPIAPLQPANCGFLCAWSEHLRSRFAGSPLKSVTLSFTDLSGQTETRMGEMIVTATRGRRQLDLRLFCPLA